jgi:signal transduction histidine kinase
MPESSDASGLPRQDAEIRPHRSRLVTWSSEVTTGRARTAALRDIGGVTSDAHATRVIHELELTYEELSVAEEELRAQNEDLIVARSALDAERLRYRELFEQAPIPYVITDNMGTIRRANLAAGSLLRCRIEFLRNKPLTVFTRGASRRRLRELLGSLSGDDDHVTLRFNLVARGKKVVPVEATTNVARDRHGRIQDIRWLFADLRPRRRLERARRARTTGLETLVAERTSELERSQRVKEQLVATVSHELRTPLAAVAGYTEILTLGLRGDLNDAQRMDLARIHRASEHMARVVEDLLNYSAISAGQAVVDIQDTVLSDELRAVADLIADRAIERDVRFTLAEPAESVIVRADPERLRQIMLNLIGNAVKYTPRGGTVVVRPRVDGRDVFIEVVDDGPGVPRENHESIFEPFVRLSRDKLSPGTGLGLAISRTMARAMGGDVTLAKELAVGSCFTLRLPGSTRFAARPAGRTLRIALDLSSAGRRWPIATS